jgi:hypothetical protein
MPKTSPQLSAKKPTMPGLPAYLVVGNGGKSRASRNQVRVSRKRNLNPREQETKGIRRLGGGIGWGLSQVQ